jgi:hypothetical protein
VEADEPLTAEDIAAGVKAVNAFKQDKAKVKIHCGVVDIEDVHGMLRLLGRRLLRSPSILRPKKLWMLK